jgi:quinol monooxygenase YgiN
MMVAALAIHHPRPEHVDEWIDVMRQVGAQSPPGMIDIAGYRDQKVSNNLIAISRFESQEALEVILPGIQAWSDELDQKWGEWPTDVFILRDLNG